MDRKHCILLYSQYSQASKDLLMYIKNLPIDLPKIIGLTLVCVDEERVRKTLYKNKIDAVPVLLVEYYGSSTLQKFEKKYIYMWLSEIMEGIQKAAGNVAAETTGSRDRTTRIDVKVEDVPKIEKKEKVDITMLAQQMAKDRDIEISNVHKKI